MRSTRAERLKEAFNYLRFKGLVKTQKDLAEAIGATAPNVSSALKGDEKFLTDSFIARFSDVFEEVSSHWLLTGEGEMLAGTEVSTSTPAYRVPLLPVYAQGGSFKSFGDSVQLSDCEMMVSPVQGADWAISIQGNSMEPEYMAGSKVLIKKVNEKAFIEWGRTYVLDTINGTVIKRLYPTETEDKIKCVSINEEYPPFEVELDAVHGIYRVLACVSFK